MMTKQSSNICDLSENQEKVKKLYLEELRNIKEREMELSERRMDLLLPLNVFNSPWLYERKKVENITDLNKSDECLVKVSCYYTLFKPKPEDYEGSQQIKYKGDFYVPLSAPPLFLSDIFSFPEAMKITREKMEYIKAERFFEIDPITKVYKNDYDVLRKMDKDEDFQKTVRNLMMTMKVLLVQSKVSMSKIYNAPVLSCDIQHDIGTGKWMLFYDKPLMNEAWLIVKKLYREIKLEGVTSMKCSTSYENPKESHNDGVIILYCKNSSDEEQIMKIGKNIIRTVGYKERQFIYYKTDFQTWEGIIHTLEGTIDTRNKKHTYKLFNSLYNGCLIKI